MFEAGTSDEDIAEQLGMTSHNVQLRRLKLGYKKEFRHKPDRSFRDLTIKELFDLGKTDIQIGKDPRVNLKGSTVRIERVRLGLRHLRHKKNEIVKKRTSAVDLAARRLAVMQMPMSEPIAEWVENGIKVQRFRLGYARGLMTNMLYG